MFAQNGLTVLIILFSRFVLGTVTFQPFSLRQVRIFFFSSLILASQLITALYALPRVTIATVVIFRNGCLVVLAVLDYLLKGTRFNFDGKVVTAQ
jgi:hypothetical protein